MTQIKTLIIDQLLLVIITHTAYVAIMGIKEKKDLRKIKKCVRILQDKPKKTKYEDIHIAVKYGFEQREGVQITCK